MQNIGITIREIRKKKGLTQKQLADSVGVVTSTISYAENIKASPQKETLKKICSGLDISLATLYLLSIEETDVSPEKRQVFNQLFPLIKELIISEIKL